MKKLLFLGSILALLAAYLNTQCANRLVGQVNASTKERSIGDRLDTPLVIVNVSVTGSDNRQIPDLTEKDFAIAEDRVKQEITMFVGHGSPVSFSLALDISDSEPLKIMALQAAWSFAKQMRSIDDAVIPQFKANRAAVWEFAADKLKLEKALSGLSSNNRSPLVSVIAEAIKFTKAERKSLRKFTAVITDGLSLSGTAADREAADAILRENTPIYFIILDDGRYRSHTANQLRIRQTRNLLTRIADVSGGEAVAVKSADEISAAVEKIIRRVNSQYTIGYYPTNEKYDGVFRYFSVTVTPKDKRTVKVFAPLGYYAPVITNSREEKTDDK